MSEKVTNFINSVKQQDYATAKSEFQTAMAERVNSAFENRKIELAQNMTEGAISEAKHSHDFEMDFDAFDANLSKGDTVDLKGLEVDDMNTSKYKKYMEGELGRAAKNVKAKVDRTGMANLSFEVVDPAKVKSALQNNGIMD